MNRSNRLSVLPVCEHWHKQEHINYLTASGDTELDDGQEDTYEYTLKHKMLVCVHCMFVVDTVLTRVVFLVMPKRGTHIVKAYNFKDDAEGYAKYVDGYWIEAELEGDM